MAIQVKMFTTWMVLFLVFNSFQYFVSGIENEEENQKIIEKVLKHLNEENNTKYHYQSAKIIETHKVLEESFLLLDVATSCQDTADTSCDPISLVCQGATAQDTLAVVKCFLKEEFPELPNYSQGFIVKRSNKFIEEILEHGLQKLERDGGPKRKIIETLSVKKRETSNTEVFITAKVTAGSEEQGDLLELEICELSAVLGTPGSMQILDTETKCFPLLEDTHYSHLGGTPVTSDQLSTLARWALAKINHGTNLVFNYSLVEVIKADAVTTPGSGGVLTTLQVRLAPSKCPKYSAISHVKWQCEAAGQPLICTMSAWDRPWRGDALMSRPRCKRLPIHTVTAQRGSTEVEFEEPVTRTPGFCTGCIEEVNKKDPKVTEMASAAVEQLNAGQLSATPHQLLNVLSAHRQVVNGIRYILNVELAPCSAEMAPCELTADIQGGLRCRLELLEAAGDLHRTLLSSLCQPRDQIETVVESEAQAVTEEPTQETTMNVMEDTSTVAAVDGETTESVASETQQADTPTTSSQEISAEEKEMSNEKKKEASSVEQGQKEEEQPIEYAAPHSTQRRAKRAADLLGSPKEVDMKKEGALIRSLAQMSLNKIDDIDDDPSRRRLVAVVSAKKQMVNGILYHLTLRVGVMPPCENGGNDCMDGDLPSLICKVQVHQDIPDNEASKPPPRVMRSECEPEGSAEIQEAPERPDLAAQTQTNASTRQKRAVVGGRHPANISDPYVQEIVQFSLTELDHVSNALYKRQVVRIVSAEKQVVAGIMNHLTLELGYSSCRKGSSPNEICSLQKTGDRELCSVSVWDRPWLKERSVQNFTCTRVVQSATARAKRDTTLLGHGSHDIHIGLFRDFMTKHKKQYSSNEEFRRRFHIFRANMRKIKVLQDTEQGTATYGATKFADLTAQEFKQQYLGLNRDLNERSKMKMKKAVIPNINLPEEFDWRHYNVVTPVKNQGACGSCWAFSVTGNVEGQWALRRGTLLSLSEQELVDCDKIDEGCNGGLPSNAYEAIQKLGGLETENDYPYEGRGESCHFNKSEVRATVTGGLNITTNETAIAQWLVKNGPISIGINANAMQFYFGGVSHPWKMLCDPADLDHGVLIVGFGVHTTSIRHKKMPYWIIKNSWGSSWGEKGYYRIYRGDGTCGVNQMCTSAIVG